MLLESELKAITSQTGMMNKTFNPHYESGKPGALKAAVDALCRDVEEAVRGGCEVPSHPQLLGLLTSLISLSICVCSFPLPPSSPYLPHLLMHTYMPA